MLIHYYGRVYIRIKLVYFTEIGEEKSHDGNSLARARNTYTYLVEGFLASGYTSLRNQILSRYPGFFRSLLESPSKEVRVLARIVERDPRSNTCSNLRYISDLSGLSQLERCSSTKVRMPLPVKKVPENEMWRLGLLTSLFKIQQEKFHGVEDFKNISRMIESLCCT